MSNSILIIDDEASVREVLHSVLKQEGYVVSEAKDGETGISVAQTCTQHPHVLRAGLSALTSFRNAV